MLIFINLFSFFPDGWLNFVLNQNGTYVFYLFINLSSFFIDFMWISFFNSFNDREFYLSLAHLPSGLECLPIVRETWVQYIYIQRRTHIRICAHTHVYIQTLTHAHTHTYILKCLLYEKTKNLKMESTALANYQFSVYVFIRSNVILIYI